MIDPIQGILVVLRQEPLPTCREVLCCGVRVCRLPASKALIGLFVLINPGVKEEPIMRLAFSENGRNNNIIDLGRGKG
jgi:hypothetical protein